MGFIDKAKEAIANATERFKDPDQDLVEKAWPLGQPDDEHLPHDDMDASELEDDPQAEDPAIGTDPDMDVNGEDQYSDEPETR